MARNRKNRRQRRRFILSALTLGLIVALLGGCATSEGVRIGSESGDGFYGCTEATARSIQTCKTMIGDEEVTCALYSVDTRSAGLSCDWKGELR